MKKATTKSDIEIFIDAFGVTPKPINENRTMFRVRDIDSSVKEAREIINSKQLHLKVVSDADMASYRCFEVHLLP